MVFDLLFSLRDSENDLFTEQAFMVSGNFPYQIEFASFITFNIIFLAMSLPVTWRLFSSLFQNLAAKEQAV